MKKKYIYICFLFFLPFTNILSAQEALKSTEEEYYDFLVLHGLSERPALNYRTLSDSVWSVNEDNSHPWQDNNLGSFHPLFGDFRARIYGPELFISANTDNPYGQNDFLLWQGRGFNFLFKGGVRFEGYGIELTLLPHFAFSQNADYDIMPSAYKNEYGYFWGNGVDAPQRFGNKPFFDWDFGDSEIRYTWKTLTVGFGTQTIWLGPAFINPMLHSNNAPAYPKVDIGLRRQKIIIPKLGWDIGDIELRFWVGRLSESDYFDDDSSNDYTMIHGLSFAYAPSFAPGLTFFANRICLVFWEWENLKYILPRNENTTEDQKASFGFSWIFPPVGFEVYGELGIDDFVPEKKYLGYIRYPFHTMTYTVGLKKTVSLLEFINIHGIIFFEWNSMEMSQDFQLQWPYSPYFHNELIHGYTNKGQWLGMGTGWGGNSQYIGLKLYYNKGSSSISLHRSNPDNNYLYSMAVNDSAENGELEKKYFSSWKSNFTTIINTNYFFTKNFSLGGEFVHNLISKPYYYNLLKDNYIRNYSFSIIVKYRI